MAKENPWKKINDAFSALCDVKDGRKVYGEYPVCDHLNTALRELLDNANANRSAIEEILFAIKKANGYIYDDVKGALTKNNFMFGERKDNG
jgi:hypothetical protein